MHLPLHIYLGVENIVSSKGDGALDFFVADHLINASGVLHGGVVYTILDVCAYAGLLSVLSDDQEALTHDLHVSVMRSARAGDRVKVHSNLVKIGRTLCFINATAQVNDTIIVQASITKSIIKTGLS